ncbi:MAG: T9SS type A sorting domain-containing protein [Candidatus Latescibacteria bacterium]|nr:T9SS type A sorting domain-containing protein [Candidatus Latescibacterota bacterium]
MFPKLQVLFLAAALPTLAAATTIQVTDQSILPGQKVTWTADNTYILNGFVFVDSSATLTIKPGTVIKGKPGQGANASALIVACGGRIYAEGTATRPIIFTALADDPNNPNDLPPDAKGLWGGVILLGRARLNSSPGQDPIEGIPTTEPRGMYGGQNDDDNSGVVRYVAIRYGGTLIGANNEINGFTLGAVGRGTVIDYVEARNIADDGFEFFGGTVQAKHLVSVFCDDDNIDYDVGYRGKLQFVFALQWPAFGNRGGELDGGTTPEDGTPFGVPTVANATFVGSGVSARNAQNDMSLIFRDNGAGKWRNCIFTDFAGKGIDIEDNQAARAAGKTDAANLVEDSRRRLVTGDLVLANNIWWSFGAGSTWDKIAPQSWVADSLQANRNSIADPMLGNIDRNDLGKLDPLPKAGSPALSGAATIANDEFFTPTTYVGAFGGANWMKGWTSLYPANRPPLRIAALANQNLKVGGAILQQDLAAVFSDPDGDKLTYRVTSTNRNVAVAALQGNLLSVTPARAGRAVIQVSASDGQQTATLSFNVVVAAAKAVGALPQVSALEQNYPNPFNPGTVIRYTVPAEGLVKLAIYDLVGQQVAQLVEQVQQAGQYAVEFNAAGLPSGTYFYRLETSNEVMARKMTLLK